MSKSKKEDKEKEEYERHDLEDNRRLAEVPRMVSLPRTQTVDAKAFSIAKVSGGWSFVEITLENGMIIEIKYSEPNLKAFAINDFKKAAFHYWSSLG